jgi:hypothetical protein
MKRVVLTTRTSLMTQRISISHSAYETATHNRSLIKQQLGADCTTRFRNPPTISRSFWDSFNLHGYLFLRDYITNLNTSPPTLCVKKERRSLYDLAFKGSQINTHTPQTSRRKFHSISISSLFLCGWKCTVCNGVQIFTSFDLKSILMSIRL